jgi:hypothetical protein
MKRFRYSLFGLIISAVFTMLIVSLTYVVWRAERSSGVCSGGSLSSSYRCKLISPENLPSVYLVLVGMGGVFVAIFTLNRIARQTRSTHNQAVQVRKQTKILTQSADAAKQAADAALLNVKSIIDKERARIRIEVEDLKLVPPPAPVTAGSIAVNVVHFKIHCYGSTEASEVECRALANIWESEMPHTGEVTLIPMGVPRTITPSMQPVRCAAFIFGAVPLRQQDIEEVLDGKRFIHVWITISYKQLFSDEVQITNYRAVWRRAGYNLPMGGQWIKCGREQDNRQT